MKILEEEIEIDSDIEFGYVEDLENNPDDIKILKKFIKRITGLTDAKIRKLKQSDWYLIIAEYHKQQKKFQTDFKKKLSLF